MITRAMNAKGPIDQNFDKICVNQSIITEQTSARKSHENTSANLKPQTQTTSAILYPNLNKTKTTKNITPTEVTGPSFPTRSTPILGITIPLQVHKKTIRSNSDIHNDSTTSERCTSQDSFFGATFHQF